jgi:hypothetical protein
LSTMHVDYCVGNDAAGCLVTAVPDAVKPSLW